MNHSLIVARKTLLVLGGTMFEGFADMPRHLGIKCNAVRSFTWSREELDLLLGDAGLAVQNYQQATSPAIFDSAFWIVT